jgi:hypothetical protein
VTEFRSLLERAGSNAPPLDLQLERVLRRRDRKRRNQRIAAGVGGIAVFVAAIWVVTSGLSFDQSTPAVPGSETGPAQTAPPPALASGAPDVVRQRTCSDGARSRLELTELGQFFYPTGIRVRFEVHRSPVGHSWRITLVDDSFPLDPDAVVRRIRVASDSGDLAVQVRWDVVFELVRAKAVDMQTGEVCMVNAPRPT